MRQFLFRIITLRGFAILGSNSEYDPGDPLLYEGEPYVVVDQVSESDWAEQLDSYGNYASTAVIDQALGLEFTYWYQVVPVC